MTNPSTMPGDYLREKLNERGWTQMDLAMVMDKPLPAVNEIINGKRAITAATAILLESALGIPAEEWMEIESRYQLAKVDGDDGNTTRRAEAFRYAPIKDMQKRNWLPKFDSVALLEARIREFYNVPDLKTPPPIFANPRSSTDGDSLTPEQVAWCVRASQLAELIQCEKYSPDNIDRGIEELRAFARRPEDAKNVSETLRRMGIRFVVIEHLPRTKIDGAAFWLSPDKPVIALSLRYDRIDGFWHTLFHELSHIKHRDAFQPDSDIFAPESREGDLVEQRADKEAANWLVSEKDLNSFILRTKPFYKADKIKGFANRIKIHPGIVTGQLQHLGEISFKSNRNFLVKVRQAIRDNSVCDGWGDLPALQPR